MLSFLLVLFQVMAIFGYSLCPASKSLDFHGSTHHSYPIDIYAPTTSDSATTRTCTAIEDVGVHTKHSCATVGATAVCPVTEEFVLDALQHQKQWITSSALCILKNAISSKANDTSTNKNANVFVLGGSFTAGISTQGCCTAGYCNNQYFTLRNDHCNWSAYLQRWLDSFGTRTKVYNLAQGGYNSDMFNDVLIQQLDGTMKGYRFTSSDLILLDLSVNDANSLGHSKERLNILERGLEGLIRRIYWRSETGSMPTIVILEMWMWEKHHKYDTFPEQVPYGQVYANVARHYNISMWSFRDSLRTMYITQRNTTLLEYLSFQRNYKESKLHLAWHQHLFYADFIAAVMSEQFNQCLLESTQAVYPVVKSAQELPAPLHTQQLQRCNATAAPLLSVTAAQEAKLPAHGTVDHHKAHNIHKHVTKDVHEDTHDMMHTHNASGYTSTPPLAWSVWEDKAGRPGFIHQYEYNISAIDSTSLVVTEASLQFRLNITHAEFVASNDTVLLQLLYMRTYRNAGRVQVLLCGNPAKAIGYKRMVELDALWPDYTTYQYSMPQIYTIPLDPDLCSVQKRQDSGDHVTLEFVTMYTDDNLLARERQKFKLIEVTVCSLAAECF